MIPKKIHYCWFGRGPKDKLFEKCYESWKKFFPDWEIIEWNEDNFDVNYCEYTKRAYELGKYAFVSDVARLKAVYDEGGIYFDTDVEVIKEFDKRLLEEGYFGEEELGLINTGLGFGAKKHNKAVKIMLDSYENLEALKPVIRSILQKRDLYELEKTLNSGNKDKIYDLPCPILNSSALIDRGYEIKNGAHIEGTPVYGSEYFCGYDYKNHHSVVTDKTFSVHHFSASWQSKKQRRASAIKHQVSRMVGRNNYIRIRRLKHKIKR